jgi:MFS family permease
MHHVWTLTLAQAFAACGTIILVSFGGIVGTRIAPEPALATLPLSMSILGLALTSLPASLLMQRIGRKRAFIASALVAAVGALLCAWSIASSHFVALCCAAFFIGANMAFVHQYRFAAMEFVDAHDTGKAVSTVMIGTLAAAILGPTLGQQASHLGGWQEFTGSFVILAGICLAAALVLLRLPTDAPSRDAPPRDTPRAGAPAVSNAGGRSLAEILRDANYRLAVLGGLASYAVMSFIMTATPLSMHVHDGFSSAQTTTVITAHLLGMYLPSLVSPLIVRTLGIHRMMLLGIAANLACVAICVWVGHAFMHYFSALVLLGVGWNLMFVAATTQLGSTYQPEERFRAQGFNDFAVFGCQAVASLLAGTAIETLGWEVLNLTTLPLLLLVLWMTLSNRPKPGGNSA